METDHIKITPEWSQCKEDVWDHVFAKLEDDPRAINITPRKKTVWLYAVASIAAVALRFLLSHLYTKGECGAARIWR